MDRDTLIAALVGGLIATIPILISNVVQIILQVRERNEKRREAKIQNRQTWIERDILRIMELMEKLISIISENTVLDVRMKAFPKTSMSFTESNSESENKFYWEKMNSIFTEARQTIDIISSLIYSFEDAEILNAYKSFSKEVNLLTELIIDEREDIRLVGHLGKVSGRGGRLQKALWEKLISLRE
jgi:hypothetical protein